MATRSEIDEQAAKLRKRGFLSTGELCVVIGKSRSHFDKEIRPHVPDAETKMTGDGSKFYRVKKVVEILADRARKNSARGKEPANPEAESLLRESKIERAQRQSRIEELRIEAFKEKQAIANGELLPLAEVQANLLPVANRIRQFSDRCGRRVRVKGDEVKRSLHVLADAIEKAVDSLPAVDP